MRRAFRLVAPIALFAVFATPLFTFAATAADCSPYQTFNFITKRCDDASNTLPGSITGVSYRPSPSSGGNINMSLVKGYADSIISIINDVFVPVLFAIAFLYFVWGIYKYFILGATEEAAKGEGRQFVLWSLIGFAVILSLWGLVNVVTSVFNLTGTLAPNPPRL